MTFRQYVRTGEWADEKVQLVTCYTDHMRKSVEYGSYSGDRDTDRYFTLLDGTMVEVEFRPVSSTTTDSDDYMHTEYGVFPKDSTDFCGYCDAVTSWSDEVCTCCGHEWGSDNRRDGTAPVCQDTHAEPIDTFMVRIDGRV